MRILVIEDNVPIADAIRVMLEHRKFVVNLVHDGNAGFEQLLNGSYDAAIVDIVLPGRDGFSICQKAREEGVQTPLLALTARDAVEDRVRGLNCGADDYLIKPFAQEELMARLNSLLRRGERPTSSKLTVGKLKMDIAARTASYDDKSVALGTTEFRMLEYMARNANVAFTRVQLLDKLWDYEFEGSSNIVDVYISQLRRKLKPFGAEHLIQTVWGVGYKLAA